VVRAGTTGAAAALFQANHAADPELRAAMREIAGDERTRRSRSARRCSSMVASTRRTGRVEASELRQLGLAGASLRGNSWP
jgi:hypothetical protein